MPDMWMDVDVALAEVPVNKVALIDDTDFKTRETSVAYNATGMELVWNFTTTAGATTQTAVTPTTSGVYDWTHQGDAMYTIEIPASGGASINNDTEGFGFFSGVCDGVLPWVGPIIGLRAAGLNNLLIDDVYSVTRGLGGTSLPAHAAGAANGLPTEATIGGLTQTAMQAKINANKLNKLFVAAITNADITDASAFAWLISNSATPTATDFDPTKHSLPGIYTRGNSHWATGAGGGGAGSGAHVITVHVDDHLAADLENVNVRITEGANVFTLQTDANGDAVFALDAATYTVSLTKSGYQGEVHTGVVVSSTATLNYDLDGSTVTASAAGFSTGIMTVYSEAGAVESGVTISVQVTKPPAGTDGFGLDNKLRTATSNGSGYVEFTNLMHGATYEVWRGTTTSSPISGTAVGGRQPFVVPTTSPFSLPTVIGNDE